MSTRIRRPEKDEPPSREQTAVLSSMAPRWRNWWIRGFFTLVLLGLFALVLYIGPLALMLGTLLVQMKCFQEIISIGYGKCKEINMPLFRTLNWYFLMASNYFLYGELLPHIFFAVIRHDSLLTFLVHYHKMISFLVYIIGIVTFVLTLQKDHYRTQFTLFGWTHVTLLIIVSQTHLIMQNMFEGLLWFALPLSLVVCNDCMAYIFGFFFGRTSLIKLSPKKTWEGFLGAFASTLVFAFALAYVLSQYEYFFCPVEYRDNDVWHATMSCKRTYMFIQRDYELPSLVHGVLGTKTISLYPVQLHALVLAVFTSWIAPFGGFMASGFKRAFHIKDFGDLIPGHGGIMDRFDCQFLMATFTYVYVVSFVRAVNPNKVIQLFLSMSDEEQVSVYQQIHTLLGERNML